MNLGVSRDATPEMMAAIRAEKARQAHLIELREKKRLLELADYIASHPESLNQARSHVSRFLGSPDHSALHWALREWRDILEEQTHVEIAEMLRSDSERTRHLRETSPFSRLQGAYLASM